MSIIQKVDYMNVVYLLHPLQIQRFENAFLAIQIDRKKNLVKLCFGLELMYRAVRKIFIYFIITWYISEILWLLKNINMRVKGKKFSINSSFYVIFFSLLKKLVRLRLNFVIFWVNFGSRYIDGSSFGDTLLIYPK